MVKQYDIKKLESVLSLVVDNGYGIGFAKFNNCDRQDVIDTVIRDFQNLGHTNIRGKYVVVGQNGRLEASDFVINTI